MIRLPLPAVLFPTALALVESLPAQSYGIDNFPTSSAPNGPVLDCAYQNDGRLVVVGSFTKAGTTNRSRLARYALNGAHDASFRIGTGANGDIHAVAVTPDNHIIIGGEFTLFDGHPVNRLARLLPGGRFDPTFGTTTGLDDTVHDLVVTSNRIYAVGDFSRGLASFNLDGLDKRTLLGSGPNGPVHAVVVEQFGPAGPLVTIGGQFNSAGGRQVGNIAFLDRNLAVLQAPAALGGANGPVFALALDEVVIPSALRRNQLAVGGQFTRFNGESRINLATVFGDDSRFAGPRGSLVPNSNLGLSGDGQGEVRALALSPNGFDLAVGGSFTGPGNSVRNLFFATLTGVPGIPPWSRYQPNLPVNALAFQADGMLAIGGEFNQLGGFPRTHLARLYGEDGSVLPAETSFTAGAALDTDKIFLAWEPVDNIVGYKLERRPQGGFWTPIALPDPRANEILLRDLPPDTPYFFRVSALNGNGNSAPSPFAVHRTLTALVGGTPDLSFTAELSPGSGGIVAVDASQRILVTGFRTLQRYLPDGSLDPGFEVSLEEGEGRRLVIQPDGRILFGGSFAQINGELNSLVRLLPDGSLDPSFRARARGEVLDLALLPDDRIAVAGDFGLVGESVSSFALLHSDGRIDQTYAPHDRAFTPVRVVATDLDGSLFLGSDFTGNNTRPFAALAKLTPAGAVDESFTIPTSVRISRVRSIALQPDGKILLWGHAWPDPRPNDFETERIIRLNPDGSLDTTFGSGQFGQPFSSILPAPILPQPDGSTVISGGFELLGGVPRFGIGKLTRFGTLDPNFTGGAGLTSFSRTLGASSLAPLPDGRLVAGGGFRFANEIPVQPPAILLAGPFPAAAAPPAGLEVTPAGDLRLDLRWPPAAQQTGYLIERSTNDGNEWVQIARVPASWRRFTDTGLIAGKPFTYRVRGISGSQVSATSSPHRTATAVSAFQTWLTSFGLDPTLAPDLDPDFDDWPLYLEFALQRDPTNPERAGWYVSFDAQPPLLSVETPRSEVLYELESSTGGQSWSSFAKAVGGSGRTLEVPFHPASDGATLLLRLRVAAAP